MKTCPQCAEEIQTAAKLCRFCNYQFSEAQLLDAEQSQRADETLKFLTKAIPIAAILLFVWFCSLQEPTTVRDTKATAQPVEDCEKLISQARRDGLVLERPSPERINVEDRLWAEFPASSKKGLVLAVRCVASGGIAEDFDYGVVYGYRSGKRLAMATSVGVEFD